jgi:general secretion pathway protein K
MLADRSGMALVLTLLAVSFLVAVTVQLSTSVNWQMQAAANQAEEVQLDAMLVSGLHLVQAALYADQKENEFDTVFDRWGTIAPETLGNLFHNGRLEIKVTDLSGRLQLNALVETEEKKKEREEGQRRGPRRTGKPKKKPVEIQRDLWLQMLLSGEFAVEDEDRARELLDALTDWLDEDDEELENGAEQGYYSTLDPPYAPANGPLLVADELLLIKGWDRRLVYGDKEHSGIIDYLTVVGDDGKININTAPVPVLKALSPEMSDELAADIIEFRNDEANRDMLSKPDWYRQMGGFPGDITLADDVLTTSSSLFLVTVTASTDTLQRRGSGILQRLQNGEQRLFYWKVE